MLTLVVEVGGRRERFAFAGEKLTIGRNEDNDLRISSRYVSQHHCELQSLEKGWKVVDMKSQNGTRVNGVEITQKMLKTGDCLEVGHVPIYFGDAPDEVTEELDPATDELTPAQDDVVVTARSGGGPRGALTEELQRVFLEYRKTFGDERGLIELERCIEDVSGRMFPRPAFATPADAAKLMEVVKAINSELNLKRCLTLIIDSVVSVTDAERGFLILTDQRGKMKVKVARNFDSESVTRADLKFSKSIADEVGKTGNAVISTSAQDDSRFDTAQSVEAMKLRSILCLPFRLRDSVIGVLYLDHRFKKGVFTSRQLEFVERFADQAAIAIENARLYEDNKKTQDELMQRKKEVEELNSILNAKLKEKEIELSQVTRSYAPKRDEFKYDYSFIIGDAPSMLEIFQLLERIIPSDVPVLVTGESGTGKELIAQAIHTNCDRKSKPFIKENCAAIPETLLESELFGYMKGAFTGADRDKLGLFQEAHEGTLFLDEIGEISLDLQKKLLRALQEGEIRPVGARETINVDVRLVTATNRNLKKAVADGEFREDLFYRINVIGIEMPPLRDRLEDIPLLAAHFLELFGQKSGQKKSIDQVALRSLIQYHWPGNVRELENEVQRACAIGGDILTSDDFSKDIIAHSGPVSDVDSDEPMQWKEIVKMTAQQKEREIILRALEEADWKKSGAARALGISRPTLDGKIRTFGLDAYIKRGKMTR